MSGLSIRYDLGGEQPLAGRNAPDVRLEDGTRLGDLMQDGRGVALDFSAGRCLSAVGSAVRPQPATPAIVGSEQVLPNLVR